ncbi:hypothetical protein C8R44DRAFT_930610 [Mycena epipterygia]|nr:hypothetical protein C8R44DRAFT_930610 [Mycena epipterygia]
MGVSIKILPDSSTNQSRTRSRYAADAREQRTLSGLIFLLEYGEVGEAKKGRAGLLREEGRKKEGIIQPADRRGHVTQLLMASSRSHSVGSRAFKARQTAAAPPRQTLPDPGGSPGLSRLMEIPEAFLQPNPPGTLESFISKSGCKLEELYITGHNSLHEARYRQRFPSIPSILFNPAFTHWNYENDIDNSLGSDQGSDDDDE